MPAQEEKDPTSPTRDELSPPQPRDVPAPLRADLPIRTLVIVTVKGNFIEQLTHQLIERRFYFTLLDTTSGGLLEGPTTSLLIGIPQERHEELMEIIRACCYTRPRYIPVRIDNPAFFSSPTLIEAETGGALIYSVEVERFEQF